MVAMVVREVASPIPEVQVEMEAPQTSDRIYAEQQVMQEEAISNMPPLATLLLQRQFDLSQTVKIIGGVAVIGILWWFVGLDAVITGIIMFCIFFAFGYITMLRHIMKDRTVFFESRKAGQIIDPKQPGVPQYTRRFQVGFDRTAIWAVPNTILRKGFFKIPGEAVTPLPGNIHWYFVDLFDERNYTCVLPRSADVANVCLDANMNPSLGMQFNYQLDILQEAERLDQETLMQWESKLISTEAAREKLLITQQKVQAILGPAGSGARRDVFFTLQSQVPILQNLVRVARNSIIVLANSVAAEILYDFMNEPMPAKIKANINEVRKRLNAPLVGEFRIEDLWGI
jgi:hypothetical protein